MKIRLFSLMALLLFLCGCNTDGRFFGAKLYAIYRNCDSAARILNKPAPKKSGSRPETEAYLQLFLALAEMHRGQIDEMHRAFAKAENPAPRPELLLLRGEWYTRDGEAGKAKKDLDDLEKLLAKEDFSPTTFTWPQRKARTKIMSGKRSGTAVFIRPGSRIASLRPAKNSKCWKSRPGPAFWNCGNSPIPASARSVSA